MNATEILELLSADELRERLERLQDEQDALRILYRAALRVERKQDRPAVVAVERAAGGRGDEGARS